MSVLVGTRAWIKGFWREDKRWVWTPGHWARAPWRSAHWVPAYWAHHRDQGWLLVAGYWR